MDILPGSNEKKETKDLRENHIPREKINEHVTWIKGEIENLAEAIESAQKNKNYGMEAHYEGMRDGFIRCLNKLASPQYWN